MLVVEQWEGHQVCKKILLYRYQR